MTTKSCAMPVGYDSSDDAAAGTGTTTNATATAASARAAPVEPLSRASSGFSAGAKAVTRLAAHA